MNNYLKKYHIELKTVSPVFIGSGKEISKKEYVIDKRNNQIDVIDISKTYEFMRRRGLTTDFESFILNDGRKELYKWLTEHRILLSEIQGCIKYCLKQGDTALERGTKISVMEFVKDAYGKPYIPGSSIKGMLRTILLSNDIITNGLKYDRLRKKLKDSLEQRSMYKKRMCANEQKDIESAYFNTLQRSKKVNDVVNDFMAGFRVSDSEPLEIKDLIVCQRLEYHADGKEKNLNVLRECIKPGTSINFTITLDERICKISKQQIISAIETFSEMYDNVFRTKFRGISGADGPVVYLGGGVGFVSKTDIYPLYNNQGIEVSMNIFKKLTSTPKNPDPHKHYRDKGLNVSPHVLKMTKYKGRLYHMGECKLQFVD